MRRAGDLRDGARDDAGDGAGTTSAPRRAHNLPAADATEYTSVLADCAALRQNALVLANFDGSTPAHTFPLGPAARAGVDVWLFGDLAAAGNPVEQFKLIPTLGLWQFAFVAGMIETYGEFQKPHYLRGGAIGRNTLIWDPVGQLIRGEPITDTLSDEVRAKKRNMELANGRLAMIGAMGFSAHYMIDGSVPFVFGNY